MYINFCYNDIRYTSIDYTSLFDKFAYYEALFFHSCIQRERDKNRCNLGILLQWAKIRIICGWIIKMETKAQIIHTNQVIMSHDYIVYNNDMQKTRWFQ